MKKDIGIALREARVNARMSVKKISEILTRNGFKASEKTIYSWESGNSSPTPDALLEMCKAYGVNDILSTFGYNGYKEDGSIQLNNEENKLIEKYRTLDGHGRLLINTIINIEARRASSAKAEGEQAATIINFSDVCQLPRYDKVSAGNGEVVFNGSVESLVTVRATEAAKRADYIVDVNGDSMEPEYHSGEMVLVEKKDSIEQGKIGIFILNGDSYIKKFGANGLISLNKKYPEITIKETDSLWFFGEVIGKAELAGD